ncbi:MAG: hypothetical protein QG597_3875 [Actinomycetota bacterium]|nr:hypothetical protein [Actinomycetota bacterium]
MGTAVHRSELARVRGGRMQQMSVVLILSSGLAVLPGALDRFTWPKTMIAGLGCALTLSARSRSGVLPRRVMLCLAAGATMLVLGALYSSAPWSQLWGRYPRYEGVVVLAIYLACVVCGARLLGPIGSDRLWPIVVRVMAWAGVAVALVSVAQAAGVSPLTSSVVRPGSLLGNSSDLAAWAVLILGPLLWEVVRRPRILVVIGSCASALTVVLSGSRIGVIAALVVAALVALSGAPLDRRRLSWLALASVLLVVITVAYPGSRDRFTGADAAARQSVAGRLLLWRESIQLVSAHASLGVGPSGFVDAIPAYHDRQWSTRIGPDNPPDSPHDIFLQATAAGGIPLLILFGWFVWLTLKAGWHGWRGADSLAAGAFCGLVGYGVTLTVGFTTPGTTTLACLWVGAVVAQRPNPEVRRVVRVIRGLLAAVVSTATLIAACAGVSELLLRSAIGTLATGDVPATASRFTQAIIWRPWDADVHLQAAHAFAGATDRGLRGAADAGQPFAQHALQAHPSSPEALVDAGRLKESLGDYKGAAAFLEAALARSSCDARLWLRRGVVAAEQRDDRTAERSFMRAAWLRPDDPQPWADLRLLYILQGNAAGAMAAQAEEQRRQS